MSLIRSNFPSWPTLSNFFDDDWMKLRFNNGDWLPAINVVDNDGNYEIEVAAPGFKKDDFSVSVANGILTISGKTEKEEEEMKKNYTRKEFSSRSFKRSFTLPEDVNEEAIVAKYEEGVLRMTMKKMAKVLPPKKEVTVM